MIAAIWRALISGPLRAAPGRALLAAAAIALGVALGMAVHLINASAVREFERAARQLSGEADLVVRGGRSGFDEQLYPLLARLPGVAAASPVIEIEAALPDRDQSLRIIGLDALRAHAVQPQLAGWNGATRDSLFDADAIRLSGPAARALAAAVGDEVALGSGAQILRLRVSAILPDASYRQRMAFMDIAAAQWHFDRVGVLTRIDLRLQPGTDLAAFHSRLQRLLPPGVHAVTPQVESERGLAITRAYRLNLNMLALIALFTGTFMVFSSQLLAMLRRRTHIALMRALGVTRGALLALFVTEGALIGLVGSAAGLGAGYFLAQQVLAMAGADFGADYFRTLETELTVEPATLAVFLALGVGFAIVGAALPAWESARRPPAHELHAMDDDETLQRTPWAIVGALLLSGGITLAALPPMGPLPLAGYAAVALLLGGAVLLMPALAAALLSPAPVPASLPLALGLAQLKATPRHVAISVAAILVSFSLVVAMLVMVLSFRQSLEVWLDRVLPADLYLRATAPGDTARLSPAQQQSIAQASGVAAVVFTRFQSLLLRPDQPPLTLLARDFPMGDAARTLPLVSAAQAPALQAPPAIWISEIAAAQFGWNSGQTIRLPLGNAERSFTVAGIWRDYSRQHGAAVIDRRLYIEMTGDPLASDAAIRLAPDAVLAATEQALRAALGSAAPVEIASAGEIRRLSLRIFDRTFAITWALELAALVVGLFGVSVAFSVQALARRREFGVLRHLGMTRRQIAVMIAGEGALTAAVGATCGLVVGTVIGLVLIHVINRQSFHWSMELHMPWWPLLALFAVTTGCAAVTAMLSARRVMRDDVVAAVKEDW